MALHVTTLAEIIVHTGTQLLQEALLFGTTLPNLAMMTKSNYV